MKDGQAYLKQKLKSIPNSPGVYRMLNANSDVLYVGKAKNLKNRLTSYTQVDQLSNRIRRMVFETAELIVVETETEAEALLLEANLIKSLKPKYNIIFRDDATYPSILITHEEAPLLKYHRGAKKLKGDYFGPYPTAGAVHQTLDLLERAFRLRTCTPSVFKNRTRPCLKYDIKRCSAPCVGKISASDYADLVGQAKLFLKGKGNEVQKLVQKRMNKFAAEERYEEAAVERDRLQALSTVSTNRTALTHALANADVFALARQGGKVCIQAFFYRDGQHMGNQAFYPRGVDELADAEVLRHFLALHYVSRTPQKEIVVSHDVAEVEELAEALSLSAGHKVSIAAPKRGDKRKVVEHALKNAENTLSRKLAEGQNWNAQMHAFGELLSLEEAPKRIECFDISNISGKQPVASLVVAGEEGMLKSDYRKFKITVKDTPDDYSMMREALTRRYKRLKAEDVPMPDIVLVDGGKGHLNVLIDVFKTLEIEGPVLAAIAKGEERDKGLETIFKAGLAEPLPIPFNTPLIFMLQRVRDEAHRFAIGFHRQQRSSKLTKSKLDSIPNVGAKRKKALLLHFGSVSGVEGAGIDELMQVEGISQSLAEHIYAWLHG
jgi:excinuclease ABC subunit C